jgi:hypothetical protein
MNDKYKATLPRYYNVDGDILVKIYLDGDTVKAINNWGNEYNAFDAVYNGTVTTRDAFDKAVVNREGQPILANISS